MSNDLPKGWEKVKLGDIAKIVYGKILPQKKFITEGYPVFGANGIIGFYNKYSFQEEKLLISCRGANSGKVNISPKQAFITNNSLILNFYYQENILRKTYFYFIQTIDKYSLITGSAQPQVTINNAIELKLLLPPLPEQQRIVAKIEQLFSELDKGVAELKKAKKKLELYRQSLLKAAFEGRLTEQWRQEHADELESAEELLARIKTEREKRYKQQLEEWKQAVKKWEAQGKPDKKPRKPRKPKELPPLTKEELAKLPKLPEGWAWVPFGNIVIDSVLGKMLDKQKNKGSLRLYLRNINVRWGDFDFSDIKKIKIEAHEFERYKLQSNDLIICEGGEPGRCAVWKNKISNMCFQKALHRVRLPNEYVLPTYAYYHFYWMAHNGQLSKWFTGTTIKHLTSIGLAQVFFPLCSVQEQQKIIFFIEQQFFRIDHLAQTIDTALQRAELLRQSILKKAFSGRLVPQDPNDEPASELLKRIKAEKEKAAKKRKTTRKSRKKKGS